MEERIIAYIKRHPVITIITGFVLNSLPGWLQLFLPNTGGTTMTTISWLLWLPAIIGTTLLIGIIIILRKPTLSDVPIILQKMHDRINLLARSLLNGGQVYVTDDELKAIITDFGNTNITDLSIFSAFVQPAKSNILDIIKEQTEQIQEKMNVSQLQIGICFEKHKRVLSAIQANDRRYKRMKKQVDNLVFPNPDKKINSSVNNFLIKSDALNNLFLLKPFLSESSLVKDSLSSSPSMLVWLDKLDESISLQIGESRRQVAEAIEDYQYRLKSELKVGGK